MSPPQGGAPPGTLRGAWSGTVTRAPRVGDTSRARTPGASSCGSRSHNGRSRWERVVARSDGVEVLGHDLQLPLDTAGYSRRACPHCKAGFKVRVSRRDARVVAAALARRVVHLNASEARPGDVPRHCPYCGARADAEAFWTEEHRAWVDREASSFERELR